MNSEDKAAIFDFVVETLKQKGEPPKKRDALITYLTETSVNDTGERLLHRVSEILSKDVISLYTSQSITHIEIMRHKIETLDRKVSQLENKPADQPVQWLVIQGIAWMLSLCASFLALYHVL